MRDAVLTFTGLHHLVQAKSVVSDLMNEFIDIRPLSKNTYQVMISSANNKYKDFGEPAYSDTKTTVFFKKPREIPLEAKQLGWESYRKRLNNNFFLGRTWLKTEDHNVSYDADENGAVITGNIENLSALFIESKTLIEENPSAVLSAGCSQPLASYAACVNIINRLTILSLNGHELSQALGKCSINSILT